MFPKLVILLAALAISGAVLLSWRAQSLALRHEAAKVHTRIDQSRQTVWEMQTRVAKATSPSELREQLDSQGLELESTSMTSHPANAPAQ